MTQQINFEDYLALTHLYSAYASAIDAQDWAKWIDFFTQDCDYRIVPRENHERGLPLATLALTSVGMLKDRVYGITQTIYHDPYYQRHITGAPIIESVTDQYIMSQANYAVFRTKLSDTSTVFNVGRYVDKIIKAKTGLKFESRHCIYDSEMIPNSLIYPI